MTETSTAKRQMPECPFDSSEIESAMTCGELEYMVAVIDKLSAKEHYAALLKDRKSGLRRTRAPSPR